MSYTRKTLSLGTVGLVRWRSKKERMLINSKKQTKLLEEQNRILREQK